jgi:steroid delta-isomerase-like uncharacterized protein
VGRPDNAEQRGDVASLLFINATPARHAIQNREDALQQQRLSPDTECAFPSSFQEGMQGLVGSSTSSQERKFGVTTSASAQLLEDWAAAWSSPTLGEQLVSLCTDDCIYEDVTMGVVNHGKTEIANFYTLVFAAFPDFKMELTAHFVAGAWAGAEWLMTGTHQGDLPGLPATQKPFSIRGASVFELHSTRFRRCSDYWDMATLLKQIGVMPAEE